VPPTLPDVFVGPYLDDLGDPYRFLINGTQDYTHFNGGLGRNTVSARWLDVLKKGLN
jgi:hypothetical protein